MSNQKSDFGPEHWSELSELFKRQVSRRQALKGGALAAGAFSISSFIAACAENSTSQQGDVNVGVPAGYSGTTVLYGGAFLQGVQVAANYINDNGGILGRRVHLIPVNTASDPVDAVTAVRQMLAADNVSLVVGLAGLDWTNALPILNQSKMVSFTYIGDPAIDNLVMPYSFSVGSSDAAEGPAIAWYANSKGYKRIALAFSASTSAQTLVPSLLKAANILGLQIVANPSIPESAPSYGAVARQIIDAKPDAILVQMDPPQAGIFFSQFLTLGGGNIPVIGGDITLNADFVKAVGAQYYADHVVAIEASGKPSGPGLATFNDGFQAAYAAPPAYLCAHAYDGMTAGALAMVDAKSTDPQVYYKHVLEVTTPGADRTEVYDFKTGAKLLSEGKKIKFYGVSTSLIYNKFHRPAADFAVQKASPSGGNTFISLIPATSLAALS